MKEEMTHKNPALRASGTFHAPLVLCNVGTDAKLCCYACCPMRCPVLASAVMVQRFPLSSYAVAGTDVGAAATRHCARQEVCWRRCR
eukprot:1816512-Rhodomonas_salina.1